MATVQKRGTKWRVQIRRHGHVLSKSFHRKADADEWARDAERSIDKEIDPSTKRISRKDTFASLIDLHIEDLHGVGKPLRRSKDHTLRRLRRELGDTALSNLTRERLVMYGRQRAKEGAGPATLAVDISFIGTVLRHAAAVHGIPVNTQAVDLARVALRRLGLVGSPAERERRPTEAELERLYAHFDQNDRLTIPMTRVIKFAIATAMRLDEIFRIEWNLCGSAIAYGLSTGGYGAAEITLTDLGRRLIAPLEEGDDRAARRDAVLKPRIMNEFFSKYDKAKLPKDEILRNMLVSMGLGKERAEAAIDIIKKNGQFSGIIVDTKTGPFVALSGTSAPLPPRSAQQLIADEFGADSETPTDNLEHQGEVAGKAVVTEIIRAAPKQLFVAHGKSHGPLKTVKSGLDKFRIPHVVAVEEPHRGRPISQKVADLMKSCSAGIFIFTKDEKFVREDGTEIWRPSENVVFELGAASVLWGQKIIILKEAGVDFPSDFKDLGYIEFSGESAQSVWMSLLTELIALDFITIQAA